MTARTPSLGTRRHARALAVLALLAAAGGAQGGAVTDGSVGAVQTLGGRFTVPQALGTVRGANLFHSFARFGVGSGESATFSTADAAIRHVIARVTGTEATAIDGELRLEAAGGARPSLYLFNPQGVSVGAGARIDVPAGLHLAAAPQLRFADGFVWSAAGGRSSLTVAAPESFGFLGGGGALRWQGAPLALQPGGNLTLAGARVTLERAALNVPQGNVLVQSPGAVDLIDGAELQAGGAIALAVDGALRLAGGASVIAGHDGDQAAAPSSVRAGSLTIDGGGRPTSIASIGVGAGTGPALTIDVAGAVELKAGGQIYAVTGGRGNGGALTVNAGSLSMDGSDSFAYLGTQTLSRAAGAGAAGALDLRVRGALLARPGGLIDSESDGPGAAGPVRVEAASMRLDAGGGTRSTGVQNFGGGAITVQVAGALEIVDGAAISSSSAAGRAPQPVQVQAASIVIDGLGRSASQIGGLSSNDSPSAPVVVGASERLVLSRGGQVNSATIGRGDAGSVRIASPTIEMTGGGEYVTGVYSNALDADGGRSGDVAIEASSVTVRNGARISAASLADRGDAARVTLRADRVLLDGGGVAGGIESLALGASGNAGRVTVEVREELTLLGGASIMAGVLGSGSPGEITVRAASLVIDGRGAQQAVTGIGGDAFGGGAGSAVSVEATRISLREGGQISSSTFSAADAGSVRVKADRLEIDGGGNAGVASGISADSGGSGRAGSIAIEAREMNVVREGMVSTSTLGRGAGGALTIDAQTLSLREGGSIVSVAGGSGDAGSIVLRVGGALTLADGGVISANTGARGAAGLVTIHAGTLSIGGSDASGGRSRIASRALPSSGGQPGSVAIAVDGLADLQPDALLTVENRARVANPSALRPTRLELRAGELRIDGAEISAASAANAAAGAIAIESQGAIRVRDSSLRTSAVDGDGGPLTLRAGGLVSLRDTTVTTSVEGRTNGNGGDIAIDGTALVLASGFVQANTAAPLARGGRVTIGTPLLVPDGSNAFIGGNRIETFRPGVSGFNVVQAAAPDGVGGVLDVTVPQLNLAGSLAALVAPRIDFGLLGRDQCLVGADSSFGPAGRGALPPRASDPLRVAP